MDDRIYGVFAGKCRAGYRQICPWRDEPGASGKFVVCIAQLADQGYCEPGARAVATDSNSFSRNALLLQKTPRCQRIVVGCWKRMFRGESIGDGERPHSSGPPRLRDHAAMAHD